MVLYRVCFHSQIKMFILTVLTLERLYLYTWGFTIEDGPLTNLIYFIFVINLLSD